MSDESFEITYTINKREIEKKIDLIIRDISEYNITDIEYYKKNESKLLDFIKDNYAYLIKSRNKITNFYCPDIMDNCLIKSDIDTDSLYYRAPEVIISYVFYIAKLKSVFLCINEAMQL